MFSLCSIRYLPSRVLVNRQDTSVFMIWKGCESRYLLTIDICWYDRSNSSSTTSASKSPPKPKQETTPLVPTAAATVTATGNSDGLVDPWLPNFAQTSGETIPDTFSDATAFTDIWSDLFQFQNAPVTPGLSMDFDFNSMFTESHVNPPPTFALDPEIPSIETQRTL